MAYSTPKLASAAQKRYRARYPERVAELRRRLYEKERLAHPCPECGGLKSPAAELCQHCASKFGRGPLGHGPDTNRRRYHREYMRAYRQANGDLLLLQRRRIRRSLCRFKGCDSHGTHHAHCECGWPVTPDVWACHICVAEQPRLEFKALSEEEAA